MGSWDNYAKSATVTAGGDWPDIPDDLYSVRVMDVSEPTTGPNIFKKKATDPDTVTQFYLTFEIMGDVAEGATLRWYITLTPNFIENGFVGEKSRMYATMEALGISLDGEFDVVPETWVDLECRAMVENIEKDGNTRPKITSLKPARKAAPKAPEKRQPVGAGGLRSRLGVED